MISTIGRFLLSFGGMGFLGPTGSVDGSCSNESIRMSSKSVSSHVSLGSDGDSMVDLDVVWVSVVEFTVGEGLVGEIVVGCVFVAFGEVE